jgi:hypothetical protein
VAETRERSILQGQLQLRIQVGCPLDWTLWHHVFSKLGAHMMTTVWRYAFPHRYGPLLNIMLDAFQLICSSP